MATRYQILYTYRDHPHWVEQGTLLVTDTPYEEPPEWATLVLQPDERIRGTHDDIVVHAYFDDPCTGVQP